MNFPTIWTEWISECIGSATTSVLVNRSPAEEFSMEMGLWQRDPLSPYLILLAAEGFNVLMTSLVATGMFHGYHVGRNDGVTISHLQFADDTLLLDGKKLC